MLEPFEAVGAGLPELPRDLQRVSVRRIDPAVGGYRWSVQASVLPYIEQGALYSDVDFNDPASMSDPRVTTAKIPICYCPSDSDKMTNAADNQNAVGHGRTNYRACGGSDTGWILSGSVINIAASPERNNGMFVTNTVIRLADVLDGTSNTAVLSEALLGDGDQSKISIPGDYFQVPYGPVDPTPADRVQLHDACIAADLRADPAVHAAAAPHGYARRRLDVRLAGVASLTVVRCRGVVNGASGMA